VPRLPPLVLLLHALHGGARPARRRSRTRASARRGTPRRAPDRRRRDAQPTADARRLVPEARQRTRRHRAPDPPPAPDHDLSGPAARDARAPGRGRAPLPPRQTGLALLRQPDGSALRGPRGSRRRDRPHPLRRDAGRDLRQHRRPRHRRHPRPHRDLAQGARVPVRRRPAPRPGRAAGRRPRRPPDLSSRPPARTYRAPGARGLEQLSRLPALACCTCLPPAFLLAAPPAAASPAVPASLWIQESPPPTTLPDVATGPLPAAADVVVIGAGVAGMCTALQLARCGVSAVVLDAGGVAGRASGRNDGQLLLGLGEHYNRIVGQLGADTARTLWHFIRDNNSGLKAFLRENRIPCDLREEGGLRLAETDHEAAELAESAALLSAEGIPHELLEAAEVAALLPSVGFLGGMRLPGEAIVQPV